MAGNLSLLKRAVVIERLLLGLVVKNAWINRDQHMFFRPISTLDPVYFCFTSLQLHFHSANIHTIKKYTKSCRNIHNDI